MQKKLSIIMYHYVRELQYTRYPEIKGLRISLFLQQLQYLKRKYNFVTHRDIIAAAYEGKDLPDNAVWLTFDDAYSDHYTNVFPILDAMGIQGAFFPPVKAIVNHEVLDVNKIHFILAATQDVTQLLADIRTFLDTLKDEYSLESYEFYWQKLATPNRFDKAEVVFVNRLLQLELNKDCRRLILNDLFHKYVTDNEAAFSRELYMNIDQLKCMLRHGMCIGSHGYEHYWLDSLTPEEQVKEVDSSLDFLSAIGVDMNAWVMSYPYGASNGSLLHIIKERGCKLSLTTQARTADMVTDSPFLLPRFDANDLPTDRDEKFPPEGRY